MWLTGNGIFCPQDEADDMSSRDRPLYLATRLFFIENWPRRNSFCLSSLVCEGRVGSPGEVDCSVNAVFMDGHLQPSQEQPREAATRPWSAPQGTTINGPQELATNPDAEF